MCTYIYIYIYMYVGTYGECKIWSAPLSKGVERATACPKRAIPPHHGPKKPLVFAYTDAIISAEMPMM